MENVAAAVQPQGQTQAIAPQAPTEAGGQNAQAAPPQEKYKVTVNGKEMSLTLDEMKAHVQKGLSADERFKQAAEMSKRAAEIEKKYKGDLDNLSKGDLQFLEATLGKEKFRALTEDYLLNQLEEDALSPEQREYRDLKKYKADQEKAAADRKDAEAKTKYAQDVQKFSQELDQDIGDTLKALGRNVTPRTVKRMAETMLAALESQDGEFKPVKAKDYLESTLKELETDVQDYLGSLTVDQLEAALPKTLLDELRKGYVNKAISQNPAYQPRRQDDGKFAAPTDGKKHKSIDSWLKSKNF